MFYTYILYSVTTNKYYIGSTSNLQERLKKHNSKNKGFTNRSSDWKIVYAKSFDERSDAIIFEKQIKNWKSKIMIGRLIENSVIPERPD